MSKKLWGGRFGKKADPLVEEFTKSIDYDYKLAEYDVFGSKVHSLVLKESGFITPEESKKLARALGKLYDQIKNGTFKFDKGCEDIHTNIQNKIEKEVGDLALKLHTARSRNDQVLFGLKMFCKIELMKIGMLCLDLAKSLGRVSTKNFNVIIPGYTHMQHAQLVFLRDYLASYAEMLTRDSIRLLNTLNGIKLSLGAGALAGVPIKAGLYNKAIKKIVAESKDIGKGKVYFVATPRSMDTVSDRDFVIEILSALSVIGMHLSRLAEDLIIWSTREFGFVELDDAYATGSSLMPQKKNPDVLELIRGYTGMLYGNLISVLTMMKGLPLAYNRDMQLDKPPLFNSFEIIEKELRILPKLIETLKWNKDVIKKRIEEDETFYATDFVYYLVKKGMPFKKAHDTIGKLVKESLDTRRKIKEMSDTELKRFSDKLKHTDIIKLMVPIKSVKSRISVGRSKKR